MFKFRNPFKETPIEAPKIDPEREWMISMIVSLARLGFVKPEVLGREMRNYGKNKDYLFKLTKTK